MSAVSTSRTIIITLIAFALAWASALPALATEEEGDAAEETAGGDHAR